MHLLSAPVVTLTALSTLFATTSALSIFDVPVAPIYRTVTRTVRVKCDTKFDRSDKTTRGQVAAEFCPQVEAGALDPAPFLM